MRQSSSGPPLRAPAVLFLRPLGSTVVLQELAKGRHHVYLIKLCRTRLASGLEIFLCPGCPHSSLWVSRDNLFLRLFVPCRPSDTHLCRRHSLTRSPDSTPSPSPFPAPSASPAPSPSPSRRLLAPAPSPGAPGPAPCHARHL